MIKLIMLTALMVYSSTLMCQDKNTIVTRGLHGHFYEVKKGNDLGYDSTCFMFVALDGERYRVYKDRKRREKRSYFYFKRIKGSLYKKYLIQ